MNDTTSRIVLSCVIIGLVACACLVVIAALGGGLAFFQAASVPPVTEIVVTEVFTEEPLDEPTIEPGTPTIETADPLPTGELEPEPTPEDTAEPAGTQPPQADLPPEVEDSMVSIENEVTDLRGLEPTLELTRTLITPDDLRVQYEEDFEQDYSPEEARDDVLEMAALGLIDPEFDYYNFYIEFLTEQVAGYYDPELKAMFIVQGQGFGGNEKFTYSHEYTHALQDQHYDLREGMGYNDEACEEDTERCAAVLSLIEGDASLSGLIWLTTYASDQDIRELQEFYATYESPIYDSAPDFLKDDFGFPYDQGMSFVQYLYDRGGWDSVDAAYSNPPVSTEQILHPTRYPDDRPITVELPDIGAVLGEGWRELGSGVIGEWYTYLFLARGADPEARINEDQARRAAEGWGGDSYTVFYNDATGGTALVARYAWDSNTDAGQFADAFREFASARFGNPATSDSGVAAWADASSYTLLSDSSGDIVWVLAPDQATANALLAAVRE
jgi:hypothetical protein